eukprot:GHRQ01020497.1.p1 GENE.GHRQ01020497.1~~GHRQ01020497.1.p1  ORF type:complete len:285 (+),score=100.40 GHRQ01020497.1:274-1128(+)
MQSCLFSGRRAFGCAFGCSALRCSHPSPLHKHISSTCRRKGSALVQATAAVEPNAELLAAAQKLVELSQQHAAQADLEEQAELVSRLSEAAGTNVVVQELNDGTFKGYTLSGQTAQRFRTVITLGTLSFNLYQPKDLKVRMLSTDAGGVYKGRRDNCDTGYVVTASFEFVEQTGEGDAAEVTPTGMQGRSVAIGEYAPVPGNPQRLTTKFKKMRLEPASQEPADLQRWLDTLLEANPGMDAATGVLEVDLPAKSPEGWLDYLMMTREYQLVAGNFGSKTLLERV